jgi:hypothetical protein
VCDHIFAVSEVMVAALSEGEGEEKEEGGGGKKGFEHFGEINRVKTSTE